ncbi:Vacuolar protein sorting-associated protein 8 [Lunasporangiospora selenospora]|uniref:Vacuolar protein sorting-associated protein 8 n=1 Tax=Lunasporangiospora selenospora TaxID=979761 RepID=A0A9P6G0K2_9FUNG|nr:Vacuolar protein sorting-associated protein 8 [Lunasporangiospora selenospora]
MSTLRAQHLRPSTQEEYEALLKEILESDSSDEDRIPASQPKDRPPSLRLTSQASRHYSLDQHLQTDADSYLSGSVADISYESIDTPTRSSSKDKAGRRSFPLPASTAGVHLNKDTAISIIVELDSADSQSSDPLCISPSNSGGSVLLSSFGQRDRPPLLSLSTPSSTSSSPSSSVNTTTRTTNAVLSTTRSRQNISHHSFSQSSYTTKDSSTGLIPSLIDVDTALEHPTYANSYLANQRSFKLREKASGSLSSSLRAEDYHQQIILQRHEQRLARYHQRRSGLLRPNNRMESTSSNHSRAKARENGSHRNARDSSFTVPIILKASNTRLVNGLQSITSLEQKFNELRIPELELLNTPDTTIKAVLADIYRISEELHMHLQGGPLSDSLQHSKKEGDGVIISGETQRQKRIKDIIDRISRETSLYEEFVHRSNYLSLDAILNEASDEDDNEVHGFGGLGNDPSELDSVSDIHREDTLSQTSFLSGHHHHGGFGPSSLPSSPLSGLSLRSSEPMQRLRPHPLSHGGPGSVASSSALTGRHSRASSASFSLSGLNQTESHSPGSGSGVEPWETFRWTPLLKLSEQLFSDEIKAQSGLGTCIAVSNIIAVGTSRGAILVYSPTQTLIGIYGSAHYAIEHGAVSSIAISSDNTYMVAGHSLGSVIVWNVSKPGAPSRILPPITKEIALSGRKLGHIRGSAVLSVGFVGIKRAEVVSADDQGMAFHHLLYKVMMVNAVETTRLLGKYPAPKLPRGFDGRGSIGAPRQSTIFGMGVLPYGQVPHPADNAGLVAILTPFKLLIICVKPQPQTLFKFLRPKELQSRDGESSAVISGNLAWFPATKNPRGSDNEPIETNPLLAFSWNRHLYIFQVLRGAGHHSTTSAMHLSPDRRSGTEVNGKTPRLDFIKVGDWICREGIVGIQWVRPQILLLLTNTEDVIVFDPKLMCETERCSARSLQIVYHDWFKDVAKIHRPPAAPLTAVDAKLPVGDMCYNNSWKAHKGKLFVLGVRRVQIGTILNWTDRILALVKSGDFLEGIALATLFYMGKSVQTAVVGLPEDETTRKQMVSEKIYELLTASLNYTFNPERMLDVDSDEAAGGVGAGTVLFHDLAIQAIESCLALEDQVFLFEDVYERYAEASPNVKGIFLQSLEGYILQDRLTEMPPQVMQAFVQYYSSRGLFKELELCICHTPCHVLEMHQIVALCQRHRLYTGLIYVWNRSIKDYVSPVVELLKVIKSILKDRTKRLLEQDNAENDAPAEDTTIVSSQITSQIASQIASSNDRPLHLDEPSDEEVVQKLYQYLSDSLLGKSFIDGTNLEEQEAIAAKVSLYSFIFSGRCVMWPPSGGELILTGDVDDAEDSEPTYPYLRLFLRHDCDEFLKVMDMAFEDSYLTSTSRDFSQVARNGQEGPGRVMSKQLIINTLLEVLTPSTSFSNSSSSIMATNGESTTSFGEEYTDEDVAHLYSFVARNYAKSPKTLALSPTTLHRILTRLSSDTDPSTREERQVAVQSLLRCYSPGDESKMMELYEQAGFYRVLEKMYRQQKLYGPLIVTYLKDPERRSQVYDAIRKLLDPARTSRATLTEKQRTDIIRTAMDHIAEIVDIDGEQAALLVHRYLNAEHRSVMETLHGSKPRLFAYLRGLLEPSSNLTNEKGQEAGESAQRLGYAGAARMRELDQESIGAAAITDPEIHEQYVELLCQYDPSGVYDYLERHQDNSYRLEKVLKLCEEAGVVDAVVWILERSGNVGGALSKVLEIVKERIGMLTTLVRSKNVGKVQDAYWMMEEQSNMRATLVRLRGVLNVGKQLCERRSQTVKLLSQARTTTTTTTTTTTDATKPRSQHHVQNPRSESDTEILWFRLLQVFVSASRTITYLIESKRHVQQKEEDQEPGTIGASPDVELRSLPTTIARSTSTAMLTIENAPPALFSNMGEESRQSFQVVDQLLNNFKSYVQSILTTLLLSTSTTQVSLPSLLRRLLKSDEAQSRGKTDKKEGEDEDESLKNQFSDYKDIFLGMLDTYKYEGQLLEMTNGLFERDLFMGVQLVVKNRGRGWRPRKGNCEICGGAFWGPSVVRELRVLQQKAAAKAIKAALASSVVGSEAMDNNNGNVNDDESSSRNESPAPEVMNRGSTPSEGSGVAVTLESSLTTTAATVVNGVGMRSSKGKERETAEDVNMSKDLESVKGHGHSGKGTTDASDKDLVIFRNGRGYHRHCLGY